MKSTKLRETLNSELRDKQRTNRSKRIYSVNLPETFEELYYGQFRNDFRSFSAFVREMMVRGLELSDMEHDHLSDQDYEVN